MDCRWIDQSEFLKQVEVQWHESKIVKGPSLCRSLVIFLARRRKKCCLTGMRLQRNLDVICYIK